MELEISATGVVQHFKQGTWTKYADACRRALHQVVKQNAMDLLVWSVGLNYEKQTISHLIALIGVVPGTLALAIPRALRPPPGYWTLNFLSERVLNGLPVERILMELVEYQRLGRFDEHGHRLKAALPAHLLARAVTETGWRMCIGPDDCPWAYINTSTQRLYLRDYQETLQSELHDSTNDSRSSQEMDPGTLVTGDELFVPNVLAGLRGAGCTEDEIALLVARAAGKKLRELPAYLTNRTATEWDGRRVEGARGRFKRRKQRVRAVLLANSQWTPGRNNQTVYRERLPDGANWNGLWTYTHAYQGEQLELLNEIARQERLKPLKKMPAPNSDE